MSVSTYSRLLTELTASAYEVEEGDFGEPGERTEVIAPFVLYGQRLTSSEKLSAGVEASTQAYQLYADLPLPDGLTEAVDLTLEQGGKTLGVFNVRSVVPYESFGVALIECDRLSNA